MAARRRLLEIVAAVTLFPLADASHSSSAGHPRFRHPSTLLGFSRAVALPPTISFLWVSVSEEVCQHLLLPAAIHFDCGLSGITAYTSDLDQLRNPYFLRPTGNSHRQPLTAEDNHKQLRIAVDIYGKLSERRSYHCIVQTPSYFRHFIALLFDLDSSPSLPSSSDSGSPLLSLGAISGPVLGFPVSSELAHIQRELELTESDRGEVSDESSAELFH
ncbi:hypothetical protein ZIOFF_041690 [Zingiber officinale]|uniref:Uncharacterized protein n=1 Tax=Zingiber officinale TaxID=94328 RepID=A0A8J5L5I8_ZINOF|nr:hypothetical protein ZIOFF_041690 [Zingiber officinale]